MNKQSTGTTMTREIHQLEISIGAHTLPAARAAYGLREGEEVDRSAFLRLLRLRVAEIRHLFWDDVDQLLHTVSVRLEPAEVQQPAASDSPGRSAPT